ncbi:Serine/threonine protein kinase [Lysinibacillus sp. TC-37]|uniref:protein kinase domain-containing protein n=2 Tax=Lysinibacillus TaxID=400634 RepID=UPI000883ED8D|nr:protein kinase [Lysinibacillus sp. TC-37]SCY42040.1 Serine/threonine protein kinase [Lysinibacillus sp. SG9]SDB19352.1 Serine/threonine protein kinase [Lysinibacillus sp. TC-37]SFS67811.1 Serine/threonine protein kinase [Lysinibacillus sp. SG55]
MMIKNFEDQYIKIDTLGSGGNGIVYEVRDIESDKHYALKKLHTSVLKNKKNKSRITRFINEIKIVQEVQNEIPGVLPILNLYLPPLEQITNGDSPFYVMPIATPLKDTLNGSEIEDKIKCILDLNSILIELHKRKIAHRDIKPENIYFLDGKWYLSDFGLVKYPDSEELTRTKESVGPWTTIAPEMKRNAQSANPYPADIYSLAKTFWMILTENYKGFDGQYNYNNNYVSLENHYSDNVHLTTLNYLLNISTSDDPDERPNAEQFSEILKKWYEINYDFEERSRVEWDFILKEISPSDADSITWSRLNSINTVLNSVSKLKSLNHTFLPGGGGLDLQGSELSLQKGFLELNLDGSIRIIKPKNLKLETFEDSQWNFFFLESEPINPSGIYDFEENRFEEYLLEISPGEYINPYHKNYGTYNGKVLPSSTREIFLGLRGNYVIFPKHSFYNLNMNSYGAYQTKYNTSEKFRNFIQETIQTIDWSRNNPEKYEEIIKNKQLKKEKEREIWLEKYEKEKQLLIEFTNSYDLSSLKHITQDSNAQFKYFLIFDCDLKFYPSSNFKMVIKDDDDFNIEELLSTNKDKYKDYFVFNSWQQAKDFSNTILEVYKNKIKGFEILNSISYRINFTRKNRPTHLFSKEEIREVIFKGNHQLNNRLIINQEGRVELILANSDEIEKHPVIGERFSAFSNTVGNEAKYSDAEMDIIYLNLLDAWYRHLKSGERKYISDYIKNDKETLIKKIKIESEKYVD